MKTENYRVVVVDSYAWIEYFAGTEKGKFVKRVLEDTDEAYTPTIVLAEVARKYAREGIHEEAVRERLALIAEIAPPVPISLEMTVKAVHALRDLRENAKRRRLKSKPGLADAIVLATARHIGGKVLTCDKHFEGLEETIWIP